MQPADAFLRLLHVLIQPAVNVPLACVVDSRTNATTDSSNTPGMTMTPSG
jgi:hypothetical protein